MCSIGYDSTYGDHESREGMFVANVSGTITRKYGDNCGRDLERSDMLVAHTLRGEGFDASEDGTGRGTPIIPTVALTLFASNGGVSSGYHPVIPVPFSFDERNVTSRINRTRVGPGLPCGTLHEQPHTVVMPDVAFAVKTQARIGQGWNDTIVGSRAAVRRLTPLEAERLQGFSDGWTLVPYRGKPMADGSRYKMIGNSMAIPPMRWLGRRIDAVTASLSEATR